VETKELIQVLTSNEGYFAAINQRSQDAGISLKQAWLEVEDMRKELGLPQRYKSHDSFRVSRSVYHKCGGSANDLVRFNDF
jgi:hypothetical protein